jgi:hypothetical protein
MRALHCSILIPFRFPLSRSSFILSFIFHIISCRIVTLHSPSSPVISICNLSCGHSRHYLYILLVILSLLSFRFAIWKYNEYILCDSSISKKSTIFARMYVVRY